MSRCGPPPTGGPHRRHGPSQLLLLLEDERLALETAVLLELERRGWEVSYVRTPEGWEVDFCAHRPDKAPLLVQVCPETAGDRTWEREVRALRSAGETYDAARLLLVTLDSSPPRQGLPDGMTWAPAARWLLGT